MDLNLLEQIEKVEESLRLVRAHIKQLALLELKMEDELYLLECEYTETKPEYFD